MSNLQKYESPKDLLKSNNVQKRFEKILGEKSQSFLTSILQVVADSQMLANAEPNSVLNAAMTAAVLDLPINPNLGFAYIIPYNVKQKGGGKQTVAQFQMGYKGYIQLALRTGQYQTISATEVYEGQIVENNPLTGYRFDWDNRQSDTVIGYASYFKLLNGFERTHYMTVEQVKEHASRYSQSYQKGYGVWKDNFDEMAKKTVLKLNLSKYAPMSIGMQEAIQADQGVVKDAENMEVSYPDNQEQQQPAPEQPPADQRQDLDFDQSEMNDDGNKTPF